MAPDDLRECSYCGAWVSAEAHFPQPCNEEGWAALAALHHPACHWIRTRPVTVKVYAPYRAEAGVCVGCGENRAEGSDGHCQECRDWAAEEHATPSQLGWVGRDGRP